MTIDDEKASTVSPILRIHIPNRVYEESSSTLQLQDLKNCHVRGEVFYDEEVTVYFEVNNPDIQSIIDLVTIDIEAKVFGLPTRPQVQTPKERRHTIFSQILTKENLIDVGTNAALWSVTIPVIYSKSRLMQPKLAINAVVKLVGGESSELPSTTSTTSTAISSSGPPSSSSITVIKEFDQILPIEDTGLFDPLSYGIAHVEHIPGYEKSRHRRRAEDKLVTTPSPGAIISEENRHQTALSHLDHDYGRDLQLASAELVLPVYPALNLRLRCAKLIGGGENDSLIASIEITCSETAKVDVLISSVELELVYGSVSRLGPVQLPQWLRPGESLVLSYSINGTDGSSLISGGRVGPVSIYVECHPASPSLSTTINDPERTKSPVGRPVVKTKWDTSVDFDATNNLQIPTAVHSPLITNAYPVDVVPIRRMGKPLNRTNSNASVTSSNATTAANGSSARNRPMLTGLTLSFSGPSTVKLGEKFEWKVFAVNRSPIARNLSLFFQSRENPNFSDRSGANGGLGPYAKHTELYPVIDRAALKKTAVGRSLGERGIVCLMNDVRIGPLYPQACFETSLTLLALSPGIHTLGGITVVDLSNGQGYDCGIVLEVVVNR